MRNRFHIILSIVLLLSPIVCFSQTNEGRRVAMYVDVANSSLKDQAVHKNIRSTFHNILDSNGFDIVPDSTASEMASRYRKSNAIRTGTHQTAQKETSLLYILSIDDINEIVQLTVSVIDVNLRTEPQNKQSSISREFFSNHSLECTELITYEVASSLGLTRADGLKNKLDSLREWERETKKKEQDIMEDKQRKYTALSFLPPVNQFRAHTSKGTANGIAILAGYGVSVGTFIWSTTSYSANKRRLDNVSPDLAEADKAREYYKGQMDICRGGQIASGILFIGTYIYGVANALANRDSYQKKTEVSLAPVAYDNGAGIALVYRF